MRLLNGLVPHHIIYPIPEMSLAAIAEGVAAAMKEEEDLMTDEVEGAGEACPRCRMKHEATEYKEQPDGCYRPDDVNCPCGAILRYGVPVFKISESGWVWRLKAVTPQG